ncbi:hypothetical protein H9X85_08680 [Anaerotignum lactatifermentans]|uniref:YodL-like domain-containing protein n=1 Tax=Anaerotignum lactatifermentans TaxID=160404 RepID=A0ABS2GAB6_9FIRM|nr:YodL domain-containing protein [Anaerotignum lactatifermentans]MBM6829704.1 hypothetical protein [Anaerotignum lactatifermentans]MBM6878107.1 hypothetical protein [Anaerotignum lactatifermentans]MBM6951278.1 hypothetical protein [Anaerotignum lactatifermentans]
MSEGIIERCLSYYSGLIHPVYEQYKLKNDAKYAIQRFCSLGLLSEYSIRPAVSDYDLYERGALVGSDSLEKLTEAMIAKKNERRNNSVSAGDVIKIYRASARYFYYVNPVGLQQLNAF